MKTHLEVVELCYNCIRNKNVLEVRKYLHKEISLETPIAKVKGLDNILKVMENFSNSVDSIKINSKLQDNNQVMLQYDVVIFGNSLEAAILFKFSSDGLVEKIQVFFDTYHVRGRKNEIFE